MTPPTPPIDLAPLLRRSILEVQARKLLAAALPPRFKRYRVRQMIWLLENAGA